MKKIIDLKSKENLKAVSTATESLYGIKFLTKELVAELDKFEDEGFYCVLSKEAFDLLSIEERWYTKYQVTYHVSVLLLQYFNQGHIEVEKQLCKTIKACLSKNYFGHSYDQLGIQLFYLNLLYRNGLNDFLKKHYEFKNNFDSFVEYYRKRYEEKNFQDGFGSIQKQMERLLNAVDEELIFTYGTLMKGERNHYFMKNSEYLGEASLHDYGLIEIGSYPGAIQFEGKNIIGEVYKVNLEDKKRIDELEGNQYTCKNAIVTIEGKAYSVKFYEFAESSEKYHFSYLEGKWTQITNEKYIWYAGYGSNLCIDRFKGYINLTTSKKAPLAIKRMLFSHPIYFAQKSNTWGSAGVSFLDIESCGSSYGIMYLITRDQFKEIQKREGENWYNKSYLISKDELGIDIVTLTHDIRYEDTTPSKEYLEVVGNGLKEVFGLNNAEINQYLNTPYLGMDYSKENIKKILAEKNIL